MYPLVQIGPFRLSSGGLVLLLAIFLGGSLTARTARARGGDKLAHAADNCFYPVLIGAVIGARLWYGVFNLDLYGRNPALFVALQISDFAWPGALLGGVLAGYLWCRWNGFDELQLADSAALILPAVQAIGFMGLLFSGEAFGLPTTLPWGVPLFGATRHPTQIYLSLAMLLSLIVLWRLTQRVIPVGGLWIAYMGLQGLIMLLLEALRADSLLLPGGIRVAQVFGLGLLLYTLTWLRQRTPAPPLLTQAEAATEPKLQEQP